MESKREKDIFEGEELREKTRGRRLLRVDLEAAGERVTGR